jgi:hypothetical protein
LAVAKNPDVEAAQLELLLHLDDPMCLVKTVQMEI